MASLAVLKAVQSGRVTQTRLLLEMGSAVNGRDAEGRTPLMHALLLHDPNVRTRLLRLLLRAGAVVSLPDNQKRNALMWACRAAGSDDVRLLLHHCDVELNLNAQNEEGQTALWIAVDSGKVDTVREMLRALSQHELSSEVADLWGVTPAMRAASLGYLDCLRALIAHLDTIAKSNNTLINIAKINHILKSLSVANKPATTPVTPRPTQPETKTTADRKLPAIRIIPPESCPSLTDTSPRPTQPEQSNSSTSSTFEFRRDPISRATPFSVYNLLPTISPRSQHSAQKSPVPSDLEDPKSSSSLQGSRTEGVKTTSTSVRFEDHGCTRGEEKGSVSLHLPPVIKISTTRSEDLGHLLAERKQCVSPSCLSGPAGRPPLPEPRALSPGRVVLKPVATVTMVQQSIRDRLPGLFDIIAQQTSLSFRKGAIEPIPKKITIKKPSPLPLPIPRRPSRAGRRSKWSKLRGVALVGGLAKVKAAAKNKLRVDKPQRKTSVSGK
ncbi:uncharacterized protein LOC143285662 [Babylonia areolata]|uniref:uncharacterized protein LOC143285662 n=1 Tax=Babylonia areolata TaxID=304850 RepID=UPI003FD371F5